jgi:predicted extracellular nuclease
MIFALFVRRAPTVGALAVVAALACFTRSDVVFAQYMPSVQTDHAAYAAGDEVAITGQGFAPHESVTLTATHEDDTAEPGMGHEPWAMTADGAGNVSATWAIDAGDAVGRRFVINAVGVGSGASHSQAFVRTPMVGTDNGAYVAGDTVTITGRDFSAGETVTVRVIHADGTAEPGMGHEASAAAVQPDGTFRATWSPRGEDLSGPQFVVTVAGDVSGGIAPAGFLRIATIAPDKGDYQPGETAIISGRGFAPNEVVTLQVTHANGHTDGSGHDPFYAGSDEAGNVTATWFVDPDDSLGSKFLVTATGQASGVAGRASFWDAGTISLTALGTAYGPQDFSALASSGTSSTVPLGWDFSESSTNANTLYTAGTGSSNAGDTYSFGTPAGDADRAFGGLRSGALVPIIGAQFTNDTGATITSLALSYTGEMWRAGVTNRNAADRLDFQYSTNATSLTTGTWTDVDTLDFNSPNILTAAGLLNGNLVGNRTAISDSISGLSIPNGATFWIRWIDFDISSSDDGLAVDDLSLTPSGEAGDSAPTVSSTSPTSGAIGVPVTSNITVTFSEPVSLSGNWFTLACPTSGLRNVADTTVTGGPTIFTIDPNTNFSNSETCTLTVLASQVSDQDANDPPDTMAVDYVTSFTTVDPPAPLVPIHDIQGSSHLSPRNGQTLTTVSSIVTALRTNGFYIQDINPDANDVTSEGIFVFTSATPSGLVSVGDVVQVSGRVSEFRAAAASLTITELAGLLTIDTLSHGNPLPAPVIIGIGGRTPPTTVIEDDATDVDTNGVFDPATDGIDFYESLEGMLVQVNDAVAVGPTSDFGSNHEIPVVVDNGANAGLRTARGGIVIQSGDFNPERIILNDSIAGGPTLPAVNVGDSYPGSTVGVIDYSFSNFKLQVISLPPLSDNHLQQEVATPAGANELAVATFNVENLAPGDPPSKFARLAGLIVTNLKAPDVLAIEEIQDNNGTTNNGIVDASATWTLLISAIQAAGGPAYDYRQIDPVNNQDGGAPGGNIRQGFLFRTDRGLSFIDRAGGDSTTPNAVVGSGPSTQLLFSPGRIEPTNAAFNSSRKPLAGEFVFRGHHLFVIANHFNSKGGDDPLFGHIQPPVRSSEAQRHQQAQIEHDFINTIVAADPTADVVVMGDINDFEFSDTVTILKGTILHDLMDTLPANERYSYVFEGNSQTLDHILFSNDLFDTRPRSYDVVHVNSEFADQASDHEPQVARITFVPLACDADGDQDVDPNDLRLIAAANGQIAQPGDPRDGNGDGRINVADVRYCQLRQTPR